MKQIYIRFPGLNRHLPAKFANLQLTVKVLQCSRLVGHEDQNYSEQKYQRGSLQKGPKIFTFAVDSNDDVSLLADQHQKAGLCTPVEFAKILKHEKNNS